MSHASTMPLAAAPGDTALLAGSLALFDDLVVTHGPQRRRPGRPRTPTPEALQRLQRPAVPAGALAASRAARAVSRLCSSSHFW